MSANATDVRTVVDLLGRQKELYARLKALSDAQRTAITGNEPEKLLGVLGARQQIIDQLDQSTEGLRSFQQDWPALRKQMSPQDVEVIDGLLAEVNALLKAILATDQADGELLAARKGATARELSAVRTGRQADAAYVTKAYQSASGRDWTTQ